MLAAIFGVGILVRFVLLPTEGLRDDMDQFVGWVHHIATQGLPTLYQGTDAGPVTFGPVMAYVWATLGLLHPAFSTITDAADPLTRAWMKAPASIADIGLALLVTFALRDRPRWAALGALAVLLLPAIPYVSAWWGQYESIFVLSGLAAAIVAARGHNAVAAMLIAVALATKPQAIPFLVPFAAWFWATGAARDGLRGGALEDLVKTGAIGLATTVLLWLPFLSSGGPRDYLANLGHYQDVIFPFISIRAWNVWWLLQIASGANGFISDSTAFLGPFGFRHIGYLVTGLVSVVIAIRIIRDPRPPVLFLGLAASVMTFFTFMTQMHERYAYAAVILLVLLLPIRRVAWLWLALAVVFTLNLVAAIPPSPEVGALVPIGGLLGIVGCIAMIAITVVLLGRTDRLVPADADGEHGGEAVATG